METNMKLTEEQEAILNGSQGETMAKVMKTLIRYGEIFGGGDHGSCDQQIQPSGDLLRLKCADSGV